MKNTFKKILITLLSVFIMFGITGCGKSIGDIICEQKVEFYNRTIDETTQDVTYETIDGDSVIHLVFPFAAANQVASKFELKAAMIKTTITFSNTYQSLTFNTNLKREYKDKYTDEQIKSAISIDEILAADEKLLYPYYSSGCVNDKYSDSKLALKMSINLIELAKADDYKTLTKDDYNYFTITFTIVTQGGINSGKANSLSCHYKYDGEKFVEYDNGITAIKLSGQKTEFTVGEQFTYDELIVTGIHDNFHKTTEILSGDKYTIDYKEVKSDTAGTYLVIVNYTENIYTYYKVKYVAEGK